MNADSSTLHRVNARLDESFMVKLDYLKEATAMSVSDIVKASLNYYYETVHAERSRKKDALLPYIGKYASGVSDGSVRYKEYIAASVGRKFAHEPEAPYVVTPADNKPRVSRTKKMKTPSTPKSRVKS
jgi:hypothetical protein